MSSVQNIPLPKPEPDPATPGAPSGSTGGAYIPKYQGLGTGADQPDVAGGPVDRDKAHYQQTSMPEYMQQNMNPESAWGTQPGPQSPDVLDGNRFNKGDFDVNPYGPGGTNLPLDPGENLTNDGVSIQDPVPPPVYVPPPTTDGPQIFPPPVGKPPEVPDPPVVYKPPVDPPPTPPTQPPVGPTGPVNQPDSPGGQANTLAPPTGQLVYQEPQAGNFRVSPEANRPQAGGPAGTFTQPGNVGPGYQIPDVQQTTFRPVDPRTTNVQTTARVAPGGGPTYQPEGTQPTGPGVNVSTATPGAAPAKPPGSMTDDTSNVLERTMEEVAGSQNPVDTSLRNVLSQVLEQGSDIKAESLVPRLKSERERLAAFRESAQRRVLSDLSRRGFQLGGAQEAAVLAELEQQITSQTAQAFRQIVDDERNRADARLMQTMQIAAQQQALGQQLGLSREELAVQARLGYGQEQLGYGQLAQAGEELGVQARLGYGQERLGQEQLAVQQQLGLGQEQIGRGQLALGQEQLSAQERQAAAERQLGYQQLSVQERAAMGEEALGYANLDVQQQAAQAQAQAASQQLAQQQAYQKAQLDVEQYGAETAQYEAETKRVATQNDAVLRDLEMDQGFQQFLIQLGFDKAAMEASLTMAEEGQTQQLLGLLNNYLATVAQGVVE